MIGGLLKRKPLCIAAAAATVAANTMLCATAMAQVKYEEKPFERHYSFPVLNVDRDSVLLGIEYSVEFKDKPDGSVYAVQPTVDSSLPSVSITDVALESALQSLLKPKGLDYVLKQDSILVTRPDVIAAEHSSPIRYQSLIFKRTLREKTSLDYAAESKFEDVLQYISDTLDVKIELDPRVMLVRGNRVGHIRDIVGEEPYIIPVEGLGSGDVATPLCVYLLRARPKEIDKPAEERSVPKGDDIVAKLYQRVDVNFGTDTELRTVLQFFQRTVGVNIVLDETVMQPEGAGAVSPELGYAPTGGGGGAQRFYQPYQQQGYQQGRVGVSRLKGGFRLENIPLGEALKVLCHQANLAYKVTPHFIYISTPEKISSTSLAGLETRVTQLKTASSQSLPKILVMNPGGLGGMGYGGMGSGMGYGGMGGQGFGGMGGAVGQGVGGIGGQGFGGMGFGGMGGQGMGGMGYGGMGGQGMGGMGYGGMGAGGAGFTNITQLFMPVNHALVGEPEPVIGLGGVTQSGGQASGQTGR